MKHLLLTTIAAVLLVGCATTQSPEPPTAKAPDISLWDAAADGNAAYGGHKETAELLIAEGTDVNAESENEVAGGPISMVSA